MKRFNLLLVLTVMLIMAVLFGGASVLAQDVPPAVTELVELPVVGKTESGEAVYGIILPTVVPDVTPVPTVTSAPAGAVDSSTTNTIFNGMMFIIAVLVVSVLAIVFMVLRDQAQKGNELAMKLLTLASTGRDLAFPRESTEARLKALKEEAKQTPGLLDDLGAFMLDMGWHVISPAEQSVQPQSVAPAKPSTPYPPSKGTPLGTDLTTSKTGPLQNLPASDGGAQPGGSDGFPPVR